MMPDVPEEMRAGELDEEGWVKWKMIPSTVTESDFEIIENEWGVKFQGKRADIYITYTLYCN